MRVYVETTIEVPGVKNRKTVYSGPGFFEVDDDLGAAWLAEGKVKEATSANEVIEPDPPEEPEPVESVEPVEPDSDPTLVPNDALDNDLDEVAED